MSTAELLLSDLARLGIHIEARSDRLRYSPRSVVTPDLAQRLKAHKDALLAILRPEAGGPVEVIEALQRPEIWDIWNRQSTIVKLSCICDAINNPN